MDIKITPIIRQKAPNLKIVTIEADVKNTPTPQALIDELLTAADKIKSKYELSAINKRPAIDATRKAYKAFGKEPNRYRPSAEALCRRIVKNMDLYYINSLVDLINVISITSGYSIGGFDINKISGDSLTLGVGNEGEEFDAIGRGQLNIANMPIYRDSTGGVGTPTSDNERTKLDLSTSRLLMCINIYGEEMPVEETIELSKSLLKKYANAANIEIRIY